SHTPNPITQESAINHLISSINSFDEIEDLILKHALERNDGNVSAAARYLNLRRGQFEYRLKKHQSAEN
ncbi:MAG: AAA family ATPase, partial [Oceanospirillales bacterium]|nr:AAA family ATPase [Oceanospirillales bacterium]